MKKWLPMGLSEYCFKPIESELFVLVTYNVKQNAAR
jgi:hypothetical protein